jgi:hypothetical protein
MLRWLFAAAVVASAVGCAERWQEPVSTQALHGGHTGVTVSETRLQFTPRTATEGRGTIGLGLGSASVELGGHEGGCCVFDYTFEIEGGYTTYRCRVPLSAPSVVVEAVSDYEVATSFDLADCEVIKRGNLHEEWSPKGQE